MLVILYYDWFGTTEALDEWKTAWEKACTDTEGIKKCKHYTSHQARYHYAYIMKMDSYDNVMEAMGKMTIKRDRNVSTHTVLEIFSES
jgi:hypothetical protein